ncbi:hypothetical protein, partial [Streptomyces sp. NPDC051577]|uniref:hypothetical protein n=1 Tax=Streptomyces sp. NPDC051577 TaxID=3155166 RepID=UPI00342C32E4
PPMARRENHHVDQDLAHPPQSPLPPHQTHGNDQSHPHPGDPPLNKLGVYNRNIGELRAAVERTIAHLKDWKTLVTRYRGPLQAFPLVVARTITALTFHKKGW